MKRKCRRARCSAVYEGWVAHRRLGEVPHSFRYRVLLPLFGSFLAAVTGAGGVLLVTALALASSGIAVRMSRRASDYDESDVRVRPLVTALLT